VIGDLCVAGVIGIMCDVRRIGTLAVASSVALIGCHPGERLGTCAPVAMYLVKHMTDASLPEIGRHFGGRHHTTVMHSIAKIHKLRSSEAELDHAVRTLLASLVRH
jgi:Bacterial dnaA protein helix-turn-helix